ncbi:hypothetical protein EDD86DRAFT_105127 [Gorgonomyces haynaldii]|nr:hypothetical protein EDD86DRAFT_105127 [Gorgonomyces haynaldii]
MKPSDESVNAACKKLWDALQDLTVQDVLDQKNHVFRPLVTAQDTMTVENFLKMLGKESILACPVVNADNSIIGMVSVYDVLDKAILPNVFDPKLFSVNVLDIVKHTPQSFLQQPVSEFVYVTKESAYPYIFPSHQTLATVVKALAIHGYHRCLIVDSASVLDAIQSGTLPADAHVTVLTQTDIVRFLFESLESKTPVPSEIVEPLFRSKLEVLESKPVVAIGPGYSALNGFRIMHFHNVTAVPVVEDGTVCGMLCGADLCHVNADNWQMLQEPVRLFLEHQEVGTVNASNTIADGVKKMLDKHLHHLWVTKGDIVERAVTFTDLLELVVQAN